MTQYILCIGECMIEQQFQKLASQGFAFGGDVYNTAYAIKLSSAGDTKVSFLSALGDDESSQQMLAAWQQQGIDTKTVSIITGKLPGRYSIQTDAMGERSFSYQRNDSAARTLFQSPRFASTLEKLPVPDCLYFSGISLAIMSAANRESLLKQAEQWGESGCLVVFDANYRPPLWTSIEEAQTWANAAWQVSAIGLPTQSDDELLFDIESAEESMAKLRAAGVATGAIKLGKEGCLVFDASQSEIVSAVDSIDVVDTTGAGDAFNGAFIASYLEHKNARRAAEAGVIRASETIQYYGAIPPLS